MNTRQDYLVFSIAIICSIAILIVDIFIPLGYLEWLLYLIPLLIIYKLGNNVLLTVFFFSIAAFLTVGFLYSPNNFGNPLTSILSRIEGFISIVIFSVLVIRLRNSREKLANANIMLETKIQALTNVNKELESFSYSVSHDLRAPLRSIIGFTDILTEDYSNDIDDAGKEYLMRLKNSAENMNTLINDILNLSKITQQELNLENFNMSEIVKGIVSEMRKSQPDRNVEVIIEENCVVTADKRLLTLALTNLLGNAWKFTSSTKNPVIEFGSVILNGRMNFYIRDNGAGFSEEKAKDIFLPFTRLHSTKEFPGTGIGLSIVE